MASQVQIEKKLDELESELNTVKALLLKLSQSQSRKKIVKLAGAWKGISVSEQDFNNAKNSLFSFGA
jgi:hypothetical protein